MKRIGIISDTHSCWDDRFALHFNGCDEIWHAGDIGDISVIERLLQVAPVVRAVRGNIDHGIVARRYPETVIFDVEDVKVMLRHIAGYPGKYYSAAIPAMIHNNGVKLMVAGHSHILKVMYDRHLGALHVNPGAAGYHGWQQQRTLVRLVIDGHDIKDLEVIELGKRLLSDSSE